MRLDQATVSLWADLAFLLLVEAMLRVKGNATSKRETRQVRVSTYLRSGSHQGLRSSYSVAMRKWEGTMCVTFAAQSQPLPRSPGSRATEKSSKFQVSKNLCF